MRSFIFRSEMTDCRCAPRYVQRCPREMMALVEGNFAPHMALPDSHGAAGYITFFRNYASTQFAYPPVYGQTSKQSGNVQALGLCTDCIYITANDAVMWDPDINPRDLPGSLYLKKRPAWWPTDTGWPWTGSDLDPMVQTLPAKARSDAMAF